MVLEKKVEGSRITDIVVVVDYPIVISQFAQLDEKKGFCFLVLVELVY